MNPAQFGPGEDFERYPARRGARRRRSRPTRAPTCCSPRRRARSTPTASPPRSRWPASPTCCAARPAAAARRTFDGVATVVAKLLNMCAPDVAYFGQKDYQQSLVIRRVVRDLDIPVRDRGLPDRAGRRRPRAQLAQRLPLPGRARARARASTAPCARPSASPRTAPARDDVLRRARERSSTPPASSPSTSRSCAPTTSSAPAWQPGEQVVVAVAAQVGPRAADRQHLDRASSPQPRAGRRRLDRRTANAETHAQVEDPPGDRDRLRPALRGQRHDRLRPDGARRPAARRARARARRRQRRPLRDLRDRGRARLRATCA